MTLHETTPFGAGPLNLVLRRCSKKAMDWLAIQHEPPALEQNIVDNHQSGRSLEGTQVFNRR